MGAKKDAEPRGKSRVVLHDDDGDDDDMTMVTDRALISWPIVGATEGECDVLTLVKGPDRGRTFILAETVNRIGRSPQCELQIDDESISRVHAVLKGGAGSWDVEDLGSRNGTFVGGERIRHHKLEMGDTLQLGPRVQFRIGRIPAQQAELIRELYESSIRDSLTGANNRRHFDERLRGDVSFGIRHGTDLTILLIDIDHFKRVNDTYGHAVGDQVLQAVAKAIRNGIRTEDVLARYGGEEFVVIAPGIAVDGARALGERVRALVEGSRFSADTSAEIAITISIGVSTLVSSMRPTDPQKLLRDADDKLYVAKATGRNRVVGPWSEEARTPARHGP
jgi:diguanylate cyclase (GGDEF)-like protein